MPKRIERIKLLLATTITSVRLRVPFHPDVLLTSLQMMASQLHHKVYFAPMMSTAAATAAELGLGFSDKRNRNPNWTDHEIMRFLEILQEDKVMKDLMAQRNKQVLGKIISDHSTIS